MKQTVKKLKIGANFHHDLIFVVHDFHSHAVIHRAGKLTAMDDARHVVANNDVILF